MFVDLPILIILSVSAVVFGLLLLSVIIKHGKESQKGSDLEETDEKVALAGKRAREILQEAQKTAEDIIQNAHNMGQAQVYDLASVSQKLLLLYQTKLEEAQNKNINTFKNVSKDIEKTALDEISNFKEILEKETLDSQKIVAQKIEDKYQEIEKELERYKEDRYKKLESSLEQVIEQIVKTTIGSSITLKDHQALVKKALEEARLEKAVRI